MGKAMGTPIVANYANLFMDMFEISLLNDFHKKTGKKPLIWLRFIDDVFFIWTDGEDSLNECLAFCQKYSETKNMKYKNHQLLQLHHPKSTNLIYHRFFKTHRRSHLP